MGFLIQAFKVFPLIISAVKAVERFNDGRKGKDKQDAAVQLVGDLLPAVEAGIGRDVIDDAKVQDAMRKVIDAVVALMNVISDASAKRVAPAA